MHTQIFTYRFLHTVLTSDDDDDDDDDDDGGEMMA